MIEPAIWPERTAVGPRGHLRIGPVDVVALAARYGTPLYVYDAGTIRASYRSYVAAFKAHPSVRISYSMKACALRGVAAVLARAGADASTASGGELLAAHRAGFSASRIQLHGNAKTLEELRGALAARVGRVVVDGADEVERLASLVARRARPQDVWLRVSPAIEVDTHPHLRTGMLDSKFGAPIPGGEALRRARTLAATPGLRLVGIHAHLGTEVHDVAPYRELARTLAEFVAEVRAVTGAPIGEVGVGGGVAIPLRPEDGRLSLTEYADAIIAPLRRETATADATVYVEPGRGIVERAGVSVYRVVDIKRVRGVRTFVAVDGGMGDNIRPALYGAEYTAVLGERPGAAPEETVAVAGKYCEGGDLLIKSVALPTPRPGELLAIPAAGAYAVAMASNYNHHLRPAVVLIDRGRARIIRRRERYDDLWRLERR